MNAMIPFVSGSLLQSIRVTGGTPRYNQCSSSQSRLGDPGRDSYRGIVRTSHVHTRKSDGQAAQLLVERPDVEFRHAPEVALAVVLTHGHLRHGGLQPAFRDRRIALESDRGDLGKIGRTADD